MECSPICANFNPVGRVTGYSLHQNTENSSQLRSSKEEILNQTPMQVPIGSPKVNLNDYKKIYQIFFSLTKE